MDLGSLTSPQNAIYAMLAIAIVAPGFIISYFRSAFITGRRQGFKDALLEFLVLSSCYYAVLLPVFILTEPSLTWWLPLIVFFLLPALIGIAAGAMHQHGVFRTFCDLVHLNPVSAEPTAWDSAFRNLRGATWVVVSTKTQGDIYGLMKTRSAASNDLSHRDLFIEDVRDFNFDRVETGDRVRGIWISEEEIVSIQMIAN